jgi:hypothetical protein
LSIEKLRFARASRETETVVQRRFLVPPVAMVVLGLASVALLTATSALADAPPDGTALCSWNLGSNPNTVNIAYPDLDASYWGHFFVPAPGERLAITGQYPSARYFSFTAYDEKLVPLDSVYDAEIAPDAGSSNPFAAKPKQGSGDSYTEYVDFTVPPSDPAPNTLYVGDTPQGTPTPLATLMYRVYVPQNPAEPAGNVPMPQITLQTAEGTTLASYGACASSSIEIGGQLNEEIANSNYPSGAPTPSIPEATDPPTWSRALGSKLVGVYANPQNAYLKATISRQYGDVVVIHGKAPTFPNTRAGEPPYLKRQVRYWSICENSETTRVISCAADYTAALHGGYYTYVISDPDERPANATAANGITWLAWGGIFPSGSVIYRNMLPAPSFTQAVQNVSEGESPEAVMGPYFPSTLYCTTATFEAGGWKACAAAAR